MNDSEQLLQDGISALKAGQRGEARQLLAEAVRANPKNEWGWIYLAALLPPEQAINALERAVKLNPQNPKAQQGLLALRNQPQTEPQAAKAGLAARMQRSQPQELTLEAADGSGRDLVMAPEDLRELLSLPYERQLAAKNRKSLWPAFLAIGLVVVALAALAIVYFTVINKPGAPVPATTSNPPTSAALPETTSAEASVPPVSNLTDTAGVATPATSDSSAVAATQPPQTLLPAPTPVQPSNLRVVQNQKAELKAYTLIFTGYDNRSGNFSFGGAGAPRSGKHFEGILVQVENRFNQTLPVLPDYFQALDGKNSYVQPMAGGRLPALDVPRLQPGETRLAWLTFEVEDGTTLRRLVFTGPKTGPDAGSTIEVNLIAPAATPAPSVAPTKAPTATPKPTSTPQPTATAVPTSTPQPTATPQPTSTPTVVPGTNVPQVATIAVTAPALVVTAAPVATNTPVPEPTATVAPTATPEPPTATVPPATATAVATPTPEGLPTPTAAPRAEMKQKHTLGDMALTVTQYVKEPQVKPPLLPQGYHYEAVKVTVENLGTKDGEFADFVNTFPFYLRDGEGKVYTVGPLMLDGPDRFDPKKFLPGNLGANKKPIVSGTLYFLVKDNAKAGRTLVAYGGNEVDSDRVEVALK